VVEWWPEAILETVTAAEKHQDIGLTDASLLVLAARFETIRLATLDERHFRAVPPLTGEAAFTLLPADA
jgi:predicted nucleic acid-binding protein